MSEASEIRGTKTGWSSAGSLRGGRSGVGVPLQAVFKDPGYYTVQFKLILPPSLPLNNVQLNTRAEVIWSVEGNNIRRLVNFGHGTAISGAGQGVSVNMFDYSLDIAANRFDYSVSCQVARGVRPTYGQGRQPGLQTIDSGTNGDIPNGGNIVTFDDRGQAVRVVTLLAAGDPSGFDINTWSVPNDCGVNSFLVNAQFGSGFGVPAAGLQFLDSDISIIQSTRINGLVGGIPTDISGAGNLGTWQPVVPGSQSVTIRNNLAQTINVALIWGIEG